MQGVLIYNAFLKTPSYLENIQLFEAGLLRAGLEVRSCSNAEIRLLIDQGQLAAPPFTFAVFFDKDLTLAYSLEHLGIRVYNRADAIRICDSKSLTHALLANRKIPMPQTYLAPFTFANIGYPDLSFLDDLEVPFPLVVKECFGSWGQQVRLCRSRQELDCVVRQISPAPFLIQAYLADTAGSDIRLYVIGGKVCGAMKRENQGDFRANAELGGVGSSYDPPQDAVAMAETACRALELDFAGVDLVQSGGKFYLLEVNSNALVCQFAKATGIDVPRLVGNYIAAHQK